MYPKIVLSIRTTAFATLVEDRDSSTRGYWGLGMSGGRIFHRSVGIAHGPVMCYPNMGEIKGWMWDSSESHITNECSYKGCLKDKTTIITIF